MCAQRRNTLDFDRHGLAVKLRLALTRLAAADDHLRRAMTEANSLLESGQELTPTMLSQELHRLACAAEQMGRAGDVQPVPHWNSESRVLSLGASVVKRYRMRAGNQEAVLAAFEEEGWPHRIDDPLPPREQLEPKYRLHFTIESLNRGQPSHLIRFFGDGSGEGVCWELREVASISLAPVGGKFHKRRRAA